MDALIGRSIVPNLLLMADQRNNSGRFKVWLSALILALIFQWPLVSFLLKAPGDELNKGARMRAAGSRALVLVPPPEKPKPRIDGQVVNLPKPEKKTPPPEQARHLAQHDHRTKKEQKARIRSTKNPIPSKKQLAQASKIQSENSKSRKSTRVPEKRSRPRKSAQTEVQKAKGEVANQIFQQQNPGAMVFPKIPASFGTFRMQTLTSRGSADDALIHLPNEGDETLLNARKYRFWSFFQRLKDQVRPHWTPNEALRRRDPSGRAFCCSDRLSVLHVVLDGAGNLIEVSTERSSGLKFLDREAERAFRRAQPFPNPPSELLEANQLEFEFGFLLEFRNGMPLMKWVPPQQL